mmetsp:Transcript_31089/g.58314  ORF Transcript_31089/g.58314 Transcript_31089/m.58314 type:complete len:84 (-) Transcript_31089:354-605(-)
MWRRNEIQKSDWRLYLTDGFRKLHGNSMPNDNSVNGSSNDGNDRSDINDVNHFTRRPVFADHGSRYTYYGGKHFNYQRQYVTL